MRDASLKIATIILFSFIGIFSVPYQISASVDNESADNELKNFLENGIPELERVARELGSFKARCREVLRETAFAGAKSNTRTREREWTADWDGAKNRRLIKSFKGGAKNPIEILSTNESYFFDLYTNDSKNVGTPLYVASEAMRLPRDAFRIFTKREKGLWNPIFSGLWMNGIPIENLNRNKFIKIVSASSVKSESDEYDYIRINFTCHDPDLPAVMREAEYWIVLDPRDHWLQRSGGYRIESLKAEQTQLLAYRKSGEKLAIPSEMKVKWKSISSSQDTSWDYKIELINEPVANSDEFYLPFYNIPESILGEEPGTLPSNSLLFIVVSIMLMVIGCVLYLKSKKRQDT